MAHSTGVRVTPGYLARVRRNRMLDRLGREADQERVKAEITVLASQIIAIMGKEAYDERIEDIPDDATYAETRDELRSLLESLDICPCVLPEQTCCSCRAAATEGLAEGEIPCL